MIVAEASKHVAAGGAGREKFIVNPGNDPRDVSGAIWTSASGFIFRSGPGRQNELCPSAMIRTVWTSGES